VRAVEAGRTCGGDAATTDALPFAGGRLVRAGYAVLEDGPVSLAILKWYPPHHRNVESPSYAEAGTLAA